MSNHNNACRHARGPGDDLLADHLSNTRAKSVMSVRQRGISLFIVLIVLLLSLIVVLGGLSVAHLNESLAGNHSDAQRAYAAAQALLDTAQIDIRLNNGLYCNAAGLGLVGTNPNFMTGTPAAPAPCTMRYPRSLYASAPDVNDGYIALQNFMGGFNQCGSGNFAGVCISDSPANPKFYISAIDKGGAESLPNGAVYNNIFTIGVLGNNTHADNNASTGSNNATAPSAQETVNFRGRYWVEVFPYFINSTALRAAGFGMTPVPVPDGTYPFIFRITAVAQGIRSNTVSVLRTYYVPYPAAVP